MRDRVIRPAYLWFLASLLIVGMGRSASAQLKLEEGEEVKVLFLNQWFDGLVLGRDKNRSKYGVEFQFAGGTKRELFDRAQIRKLCEVDAMDLARNWESANGKFKVEAALKTYTDDSVVLSKTDGNEITVPESSLSEKDLLYLKKFRKAAGQAASKGMIPAPVPRLPPLEEFGGSFGEQPGILVGTGTVEPLGPLPSFLTTFEQSGLGFLFARQDQKVVAVIPVGGPEQLVLLTAREDNWANRGAKFQSQAYWVSLKQQKVLASVPLTPDDFILDYDPRSKTLVSVQSNWRLRDRQEDFITVWSLKPGEDDATPVVRWNAKIDEARGARWAKIVSPEIVLAKTERQVYQAWNHAEKRVLYSFKTSSFFDAPVVLSSDRGSLLIPEDGKVAVLDAKTGGVKFSLSVEGRHVSGVNVSPDGKRLAALTEQNVFVWDLTSSSPKPQVYDAPLIGSPFGSRLEWVDDDLLLAEGSQGRILYRLSLQLPVWSYRMDVTQEWLNRNPLANQVLDGLLLYIAEPERSRGAIAVGAVKLPGPQVNELTSNLNRPSLMLIKPGVRVGIKLGSVTNPAQVEQWLMEKIQANGWVYDRTATIFITGEMGVGQTQTETYREMGISGKTTSVTFTPHFANLVIKQGDVVVWQTGTSTGAPAIVRGDNIQAEVSKSEVPQVDFFRHVTIPKEIIDPKYSRGFGVSQLGLRGIEVTSTSPPGREADPTLADQKSEEDRRESEPGGKGE